MHGLLLLHSAQYLVDCIAQCCSNLQNLLFISFAARSLRGSFVIKDRCVDATVVGDVPLASLVHIHTASFAANSLLSQASQQCPTMVAEGWLSEALHRKLVRVVYDELTSSIQLVIDGFTCASGDH